MCLKESVAQHVPGGYSRDTMLGFILRHNIVFVFFNVVS